MLQIIALFRATCYLHKWFFAFDEQKKKSDDFYDGCVRRPEADACVQLHTNEVASSRDGVAVKKTMFSIILDGIYISLLMIKFVEVSSNQDDYS